MRRIVRITQKRPWISESELVKPGHKMSQYHTLLDGSTVFKRSNDVDLRHAQYCTRSVPRGYKEICTTKIAKVDVECVANLVDVNVIVNVQQLYTSSLHRCAICVTTFLLPPPRCLPVCFCLSDSNFALKLPNRFT